LRQVPAVFASNDGRGAKLLSSRTAYEPIHLPDDLVAQLGALSRSHAGTLFMILLAGFKALLLARSGRSDICVATPIANRSQPMMDGVIGPFANTVVIRTRIHADLSFREALCRVRHSVLEAHAMQELPFEVLSARLAEEGVDPTALVQIFFVLQNSFRPLELPHVAARSFGNIHLEGQPLLPIDHNWLTVRLKEEPSGIVGSCNYKINVLDAKTIKGWMTDYRAILAKAVADPCTPIGRLADH